MPSKDEVQTLEKVENPQNSLLWKIITFIFLGLGFIGIFLPLLPTTPFLLLAAWSAPKASPKLERWLYAHPRFGPPLKAWKEERAVSLRSKMTALSLMSISWGFLYFNHMKTFVLIVVGITFVCVLTYLFSLPTPKNHP